MLRPEEIAEVCHDANRALQRILNDPVSPEWVETDYETRQSAVQGVLLAQDGATPEQLHESWVEYKVTHGWTYSPEPKNVENKTHPCLVPYGELPIGQMLKDCLFFTIVDTLTRSRD